MYFIQHLSLFVFLFIIIFLYITCIIWFVLCLWIYIYPIGLFHTYKYLIYHTQPLLPLLFNFFKHKLIQYLSFQSKSPFKVMQICVLKVSMYHHDATILNLCDSYNLLVGDYHPTVVIMFFPVIISTQNYFLYVDL